MLKCWKYVCLYGRWCMHLQYSRSQLAMYTITRNPPHCFSSLLYKLMSGSDTDELPTAGDLNNKLEASYLCNVHWEGVLWSQRFCDAHMQHLISIIFPCIGQCTLITTITGRCCLWRCTGLVADTFGRVSYLRKNGNCSSFEVVWQTLRATQQLHCTCSSTCACVLKGLHSHPPYTCQHTSHCNCYIIISDIPTLWTLGDIVVCVISMFSPKRGEIFSLQQIAYSPNLSNSTFDASIN